ncbi:hypothetical protein [uncultured Sphingomonas sp.]|uniref:hypothetical protein n=1 Tax=uncultured Sphingomonas sp. TaxID=158754 RepID=UPI0035CC36CC
MTAKTSARRRAAFLAALAATGNKTLAAERAKVSRSWVTLHGAADPAFRAAMAAAVAGAKARLDGARLSGASGVGPDGRWRAQDGEELAVRGSNGRWTQVARARPRQWTPRVEARFLGALAASCNVKRACTEAGLSHTSAYAHRKRWPAFAQSWDRAIEDGYDRLATAAVAAAGAMLGDADMVPDAAMGPVSFDDAIRLLGLHKRRAIGVGRAPGRAPRRATLDELAPSILAKLELVERARQAGMTPDERAARERELAALRRRDG